MRPLALIPLLAACGDPSAVVPELQSATITSDSDSPLALARIDAVVTLHAGGAAEGAVEVIAADLTDATGTVALDLAFSDAFEGTIAPDETVTASLFNAGTSNATLEPWCRASADLTVTVGLAGDDGTRSAPHEVTVICSGG